MHKLNKVKQYGLDNNVPIIDDDSLNFIRTQLLKNNVEHILEVGTAIGYSAINFANVSNEIRVDTLEKDKERIKLAKAFIIENNLSDRITVYEGDAYDFEPTHPYDFIFLDAAKAQYLGMLEKFWPYLKEDGFIIVDNLIFHGMIYDYPEIANRNTRQLVKKIIKFREYIKKDSRMLVSFHDDIGDGLALIRKRTEK